MQISTSTQIHVQVMYWLYESVYVWHRFTSANIHASLRSAMQCYTKLIGMALVSEDTCWRHAASQWRAIFRYRHVTSALNRTARLSAAKFTWLTINLVRVHRVQVVLQNHVLIERQNTDLQKTSFLRCIALIIKMSTHCCMITQKCKTMLMTQYNLWRACIHVWGSYNDREFVCCQWLTTKSSHLCSQIWCLFTFEFQGQTLPWSTLVSVGHDASNKPTNICTHAHTAASASSSSDLEDLAFYDLGNF